MRRRTTEWGIPFADSMIRAMLDGRKDVTRRISPQWAKRKPGDRLWVRETHALLWAADEDEDIDDPLVEYRADGDPKRFPGNWPPEERANPERPRWRPPMFMFRHHSRIDLEVVRIDPCWVYEDPRDVGRAIPHLWAVDQDEGRREGFGGWDEFYAAWRSMHGDYGHPDRNEIVWRVEFRVVPGG